MSNIKFGLLPRVFLAIVLGLLFGGIVGTAFVKTFSTFNVLFGQYLGFCIPLIIVGLVVPGIADLGNKGGRLLLFTVVLAYGSTFFAGFFAYGSCSFIFPNLLNDFSTPVAVEDTGLLKPFFVLEIPPVINVMTALVAAFVLGIGIPFVQGETLKRGFIEFREIVTRLIVWTVIPLLPIHIFGLFLNMSHSGTAFRIIRDFGLVIGVIFLLHITLLLIQFCVAGLISRRNPFRMLWTMLPAYMTALGTSSSAATIPITLAQTKKIGVSEGVADFCIPLCATIHLSGSMVKITATALAVCMMNGLPHDWNLFTGFIILLGVMMVAAPGIPGGAIMASIGVLSSVLGFNEAQNALMIAIYLAIDSFGTAGNVTGDAAIAAVIDHTQMMAEKNNEIRGN